MVNFFDTTPVPLRDDLKNALNRAHERLGRTGDWLTGSQRRAVVEETRQAWNCQLCRSRKFKISPYMVDGNHQSVSDLPQSWLEVIHRTVIDPGRLSERWFEEALKSEMLEDELIEVISICVKALAIDLFAEGIGMDVPPLPIVESGQPEKKRPSEARRGPGWAATIGPEDANSDFTSFYANESHFYIRRSLTLVPQETLRLWELLNSLYIEDPRIFELEGIERGISRAQMEFLAARASALLGCYY